MSVSGPALGPYHLIRTIGEGEFGKVKLATHSQTGREVAIKLCKKSQVIATPNGYTKLMREISTLKMVKSHPYIISLIEVIETDAYIAIVMELAKGGELFEHILTNRCLNEDESRKLFAQIICAVGFIHSIGIVHRDLKLENILLDGEQNVLVTDFGFANRSLGPDGFLRTSCGSPCYAAPELVTSDGYVGESADIWSCGVILFSMIAGYLPYDDDPENPDGDNINLLYNYILETKLEYPDHVPIDCQKLINRILVPDPQYRANMDEIMGHVWLAPVRHYFQEEIERRKAIGQIQLVGPGFSSPTKEPRISPSPKVTQVIDIPQPSPAPETGSVTSFAKVNGMSAIEESPVQLSPPSVKSSKSNEHFKIAPMDITPSPTVTRSSMNDAFVSARPSLSMEGIDDTMVVEEPDFPAMVFPESAAIVPMESDVKEILVDEPEFPVVVSENSRPVLVPRNSVTMDSINSVTMDSISNSEIVEDGPVLERDVIVQVVNIPAANSTTPSHVDLIEESILEMQVSAMDIDPTDDDDILLGKTHVPASARISNVNLQPNPPRNSIAASSSQLGSPSTPTKSIIPATPTESQPPTPTNRTSSPQQTNRSSKHTIETFVREEIIRAFTPPLPETENRSFSSSNSTIAIPKRVDSIMDDGFVYVDGNYLHVNGQGVVSSFHEKNLPPTPSVVAERNAEVAAAAAAGAANAPRPSISTGRSHFAEFMANSRLVIPARASGDNEPTRGILRGPESPPIPSIGGASKKVSIKEPATVPEVDMPKSNWFGAGRNPFKRSESPSSPVADSPRSLKSPAMSERSESGFRSMFRSRNPMPRETGSIPTGGLNTQRYQETEPTVPSQMRQVSTTQYNTLRNSELRGSSESLDLARIQPFNSPPSLKQNERSNTALSFVPSARAATPGTTGYFSTQALVFPLSDSRPVTPLPISEMTARSGTVLSLSASEYHVQFATNPRSSSESVRTGWDNKKMRTHVGTADCRAISRRNPESLLADLEAMFEQRGFIVVSRNQEDLGDYRIKVTRPGYLVRGDEKVGENEDIAAEDAKSGVAVSVTELSKFMNVPQELTTEDPRSGFVPLPPVVSRTISRNEKLKQTSKIGRMLSGLPASLSKKVKYVKEYGLHYNNGFAPNQVMVPSPLHQKSKASVVKSKVHFVDEIVFYVELQKVANLPGMCVVTFKRVRGNIWSFKKLYNGVVEDLPLI